jgi:hypothetical protein
MLSFANVYFFGSGLFNELQPIQIKNSVRPSLPRELSWRRSIAPKPFLSGHRREILHTGKHNTMFGFNKDIVAGSHSRKDCVRLHRRLAEVSGELVAIETTGRRGLRSRCSRLRTRSRSPRTIKSWRTAPAGRFNLATAPKPVLRSRREQAIRPPPSNLRLRPQA